MGAPDVNACFANKTLQYADINVQVKDVETDDTLSGIPLILTSGLTSAKLIGSETTNDKGEVVFPKAPFNYYNVGFKGDSTYLPTEESFVMQNDKLIDVVLYLHKKNSNTIVLHENVYNTLQSDRDFAL